MTGHLPSLFLAILITFLSNDLAFAQTENPNPGPRSQAEAALLLEEGRAEIPQKKYDEAILHLKRLIDRYPSDEKVNTAYPLLVEAYFLNKKFRDVLDTGKDALLRNPNEADANRIRLWVSQSYLALKQFVESRLSAEELLKNKPNDKQKATAYSIQFQCLLEEKQYADAQASLDALISMMEKTAIEPFPKLIPEFKMTLEMRKCTISHLLKNKQFSGLDDDEGPQFTEEELSDYFSKKNLCFKSALPTVLNVSNSEVIHEWCESFTQLNHELEKLRIDPFLKQKFSKDLKETFEFSNTLSKDLSKCYVPYKAPKVKKRHRKRRVHAPRTSPKVVRW